jgi:EamA domain-containing membrane protein RarD
LRHDIGDRRHDGHHSATSRHTNGGCGCLVEHPGQYRQHSVCGLCSATESDLVILAMFGFFQVALGLTLYVLGSRLLPSAQASLIATLETPLMPFWVWLAFQETPAQRTMVGGALVMAAVIVDIISDMHLPAKSQQN